MHQLALTVGGFGITPPAQIQPIINKTTGYGGSLFGLAIGILFLLSAIIALFFFVYGGYKIIMSQGDPKEIANGRSTIIYAAVGLAVVFFSYLVLNFLGKFFGANLLGPS